jgi:flavin reductase (DIM6/NTAB) family NADH-FMN oxidoreductase RutF
MFYEMDKGHGLPHDPVKALIAPRPVGWISTRAADGSLNIGPYSYFNAVSAKPYIVYFSSDGEKDSTRNARETGEFVANLVTRELADVMVSTAVNAPHGTSEFELCGLTPAPARMVKAPRIGEAKAALECVVTEIIVPRDRHGAKSGNVVVMGEVVGVHIDDDLLRDGLVDVVVAGNVGRLGYMDYIVSDDAFQRRQPRWTTD